MKRTTSWTPEQVEQLRARYAHEQTSRIAADLDHSLNSTYRKAALLGLKKSAEYLAGATTGITGITQHKIR